MQHGETSRTALQIFEASRLYLLEFQSQCNSPTAHQPHAPTLWKPSPPGWYKANVEGAVFKERGQCGIGVVVQNDKGQVMGALSKTLPYPLGALETGPKLLRLASSSPGSWALGRLFLKGIPKLL